MIYTIVRKNDREVIDAVISFDSITSFDESWSASVTTQTVEKGFNISDHVNIEPEQYSIDAIISSYSLFNPNREIFWDGESFTIKSQDSTDSHIEARDELIRIFKEGKVISLMESSANSSSSVFSNKVEELQSGHFKEISPCVMTSLSISHPNAGSGAFYVSIKIQRIHTATVQSGVLDKETPSLVGLTPSATAKVGSNSKSSNKTNETDEDTGNIGDLESIPKPTRQEGGLDWYEEYNSKQAEKARVLSEAKKWKDMNDHMARTKELCGMQKVGGNLVWRCARVD